MQNEENVLKRSTIAIPRESLTFPLRQAARNFPEKVAIISPDAGGQGITYRTLEDHSSLLAAALVDLGVDPGDRVALWMKNSPEYVLSFYGILKAGAVVVPMSTFYGEKEVLNRLGVTQAKGLLAADSLINPLMGSLRKIETLRFLVAIGRAEGLPEAISFSSLLNGSNHLDRSIGMDPVETLAVLPFSSGTTGLPKGVMLTHSNLLSNLYQIMQNHEFSDQDVLLSQLPFSHIFGMTVLMGGSVMAGATQVLATSIRPFDKFLDLFEAFRPTLFFTVPLIVQEFCHHPRVGTMDWRRLRYVSTGGGPVSPEIQELFTRITGVPIRQGYGMTEASPTTHGNPIRRIKVGSSGLPVANTEDKIVDPQTCVELPTNKVGEIWIRGPQVMKGYYQDPRATAETLIDGWLRTGDLGRKDEEGYLFVVGRLKELIKTKGFQVSPVEIEHILVAHPGIKDAAVVAEPHPDFGEVPVAGVVLQPNVQLSPEAIIEYAARGIAKYKRLSRVVFTDSIPRSPSGKILRHVLKEVLIGAETENSNVKGDTAKSQKKEKFESNTR